MGKNNKLRTQTLLCAALTAFSLHVFGEESYISITDTYTPESIIHIDKDGTHYVRDLIQGTDLNTGELASGEKIGSGSYGTVFKGSQDGKRFVVKQANTPEAASSMQDELERSLALFKKANELTNDPLRHAKLLGLGAVIPVIGATSTGGIVQEYANGKTLFESANPTDVKYLLSELYQLIKNDLQDLDDDTRNNLALTLINTAMSDNQNGLTGPEMKNNLLKTVDIEVPQQLTSIDSQQIEKLVRDLKITIEEDNFYFFDEQGYPRDPKQALEALCSFFYALFSLHTLEYAHCDIKAENVILTKDYTMRLIDLGCLTPFDSRITIRSSNGAPEKLYFKQLSIAEVPDATAAYDIYCSVGIILRCLFGSEGRYKECDYFRAYEADELPGYVQLLQNQDFFDDKDGIRFNFFKNMLKNLNNDMAQSEPNRKTHKNYPPAVLEEICEIVFQVTDPNPANRPAAVNILEKLQNLALSNWDEGKYQIEIPAMKAKENPIEKHKAADHLEIAAR